MSTHRIVLRPLTPAIGAEVEGVALDRLNEQDFARIRRALLEHQVLFFPDQRLGIEQQRRFSSRFGPLMALPYIEPVAGYADVIAVLKEADEHRTGVFGGDWHTDFSFLAEPPMASVLYAKEVPPSGGDTLWANLCNAYDALPASCKDEIETLAAVHTGAPYGAANPPPKAQRAGGSVKITRGDPAADAETLHPVVCRHPETGRRMLFVNPIYTLRLEGLTVEESRPLLERLYAHCTRPEFTCRHAWRAGDVAVWDNRCTLHYAVNDYDGHRRLLYRTAIAGGRPDRGLEPGLTGPANR